MGCVCGWDQEESHHLALRVRGGNTPLFNLMINKNLQFIPGLSEKPSQYKALSKYMNILNIDWNNIHKAKIKGEVIVGFSFGAILACTYALKHKVETLVLCSMTEGVETLKKVKAKQVIFLVGEKEKWCIKEIDRVSKTLPKNTKWYVQIIQKAGHKIEGNYKKTLLNLLKDVG